MNFNDKFIVEQTKAFGKLEKDAEEMYSDVLKEVSDESVVETFKLIRDEEVNHQQIVKDILGILQKEFPSISFD